MLTSVRRAALKRLRALALRGDNNHCPICGKNSIAFLPYGVRKRANAQCPQCDALERQRMIWHYAQAKGLFSKPLKLLHVSPERVLFAKFSQNPSIEYVPIDKFDPGYRYPKGTLNVDITQMPFADNSFDALICIHVLEHVPDDALAMRELFRVLKPGGWGIIQVPLDKNRATTYEDFSITDPVAREKAFGQPDHVRWYGLDFKDRLAAAGFQVTVEDYTGSFSAADRFRFGFPEDDDIYFCVKG